jgi:hypothetical protein
MCLAAFAGTLAWAYATFDYWESAPILLSTAATAGLAGGAAFASRRSLGFASFIAFVMAAVTFVSAYVVTVSRWEG